MPLDFFRGRHAGVTLPLFSIPSRESWGLGEIPDITRLGRWIAEAGFDFVQLLPLNEMAEGQNSPYSALSAMAIDPVFIAPAMVPEIQALGGEAVLDSAERDLLRRVRASRGVEYSAIRLLKRRVLRLGFEHFLETDWRDQTRRAQAFEAFIDRERWWLDEYALFRAIHAHEDGRHWRDWDRLLRDREPSALKDARHRLRDERLFYAYLQWLAADQWARARAQCGVGIFGDFPFMVSGDSADVWSRQDDFRLDASVGSPPDAFSVTGQNWGFPAYRWKEIASHGYEWLAARARRAAELFAGYRVDHLVGFFRTYVREPDGSAGFVPSEERTQIAQGERLLRLFASAGARVIAEDLGLIPDFVRDTMTRLGIAGYKVLRWEREWLKDGQPFRDPLNYPTCSVVTSSTHDTETLAGWWDEASPAERAATMAIPFLHKMNGEPADEFNTDVRDGIIELLFASAADLLLLPIQDIFGWRDRINTPALISEQNWTWRLSWPVEDLQSEPESRERAGFTRQLADRYHRR